MKKIVAVLAVAFILVVGFTSLENKQQADPGTGGLTPNSVVVREEV